MLLAEATATVDAHFERHDPQADHAELLQLAGWCEQFSPIVGIERPDSVCMNVTGLASLFGGERSLIQQAVRAFHRRGYLVRGAVADTLGAAWAVARYGTDSPMVVPYGQTVPALTTLPVAALRLRDELEILSELGIETIGQLSAISRDALATQFDPQVLLRLDQATGIACETIAAHRPLPEITAETQLEFPTDNRQAVTVILTRQVDCIVLTLRERQLGVIQLECAVDCEGGQTVKYIVGLYRASANPKHLLELAGMQLDRLPIPHPIVAIRLSVLSTAPLLNRQQELFDQSQHDQRRQVGLLVDRLSSRLGREAVVRAIPQVDAQPELAFWYEPLAGMPPRKTRRSSRGLPRPLLLENKPLPLETLSVVPDGPPIQFQFHGCHRIAQAWGPERIRTGWWRGGYVQRDYYQIETTTGRRFWLFRRFTDKKWFLHGVFD